MTNEAIYGEVAKNTGLDLKIVKGVYLSYWAFIRDKIQDLPLKTMNEEDFDSYRVNFSIPYFGKMYLTKQRFKNIRAKFEYDTLKKDKPDIHNSDNDG